MTKPTSDEIRSQFLEFFKSKGHEVVGSAGVVPRNDPTLLFTNAGMVQFKDAFLGEDRRAYTRAATSQKCVRMSGKHNDLNNVGKTARHHTFFEMLGNFSFGDYFKRDAIAYAWELLTVVWKLPKSHLVITVFGGEEALPADDEAREIWKEVTGFGDDRIIGLGRADNFWTMGDTGPCGPCTEIHYFMGPGEPDLAAFNVVEPGYDGAGWMEIWNNVFMQFNRAVKDGPLVPLPAQSVDTGMGLERITAVLQGVTSNYDTDLLRPLVERAAEIGGKAYGGSDSPFDVACRVIADHARMTAFALAEGITPSNKDRGAALRSVMRRAIRFGYLQGLREPTFDQVVALVIDRMGGAYPELFQHRDFILSQSRAEDVRFRETVPTGLALLEKFEGWRVGPQGERVLPGEVAFDLHATYGFPYDLTMVIGEEWGFAVDGDGFAEAMKVHSSKSRGEGDGASVSDEKRVRVEHREALAKVGPVDFVGYGQEVDEARVVALFALGDDGAVTAVESLATGARGQVVTSRTPFYGEAGGQVGDTGVINAGESTFKVTDTQKPVHGLVVHVGTVTAGGLAIGDAVTLAVDREARQATRRNHSATHLLHWALRKVLGAHAQQKGSKVSPEGLRFDYASTRALTEDEVARIENLVNDEVLANLPVETEVTTQSEARARGAMMIFEEKYGDAVRLLRIGRESVELCGGTHASRTGDIGLFKVVSDANVGAGVRRIEAVTGFGALELTRKLTSTLQRAADTLKAPVAELGARVEKAVERERELQREVEALKRQLMTGSGGGAAEVTSLPGGNRLVVARAPVGDEKGLRELADHLRDKHAPAVVVVGATTPEGKALLVVAVSKEATGLYQAGKIVGQLAAVVGGRGGGRPDMASAGGPDGAKLDEAFARAHTIVA
jgi:alanyl-tRNA synthetase